MAAEGKIENQIGELGEQVAQLSEKVENLALRLARLEKRGNVAVTPSRQDISKPETPRGGVITKVDQGAWLSRVAALCFLLVIGLILRTITDNEIVSRQLGSIFGLSYAGLLVITGWWLYSRASKLSPVFTACGMLLLLSIVYETHSRFHSLPTFSAYSALLATSIVAIILSLRYRATLLIYIGTLGTTLIGLIIAFPNPIFPYLGLLFVSANIGAFLRFRLLKYPYLRYPVLVFTFIFWFLWVFRLTMSINIDQSTTDLLSLAWFFPMLVFFLAFYQALVLLNIKDIKSSFGIYEAIVPTLTSLGAFFAGWPVAKVWYGSNTWLGVIVLVFIIVHFIAAWWVVDNCENGMFCSNSFSFAGSCLVILGLVLAKDYLVWLLPLSSAVAVGLVLQSAKWRNGGLRLTSYFLQLVTCLFLVASGVFFIKTDILLLGAFSALVVAGINLWQYRWCRLHPPDQTQSFFYQWIDKHDYGAVVLLVVGLISGFYFAQLILLSVISGMMTEYNDVMQSGRSVLFNLGSVILLTLALRKRNTELVTVAGIVAILGAIKIAFLDLFGLTGLHLVVSIFSFGVVATWASVVMGRWQKKEPVSK